MKNLLLITAFFFLTLFNSTTQHFHWAKTETNTFSGSNMAGAANLLATVSDRSSAWNNTQVPAFTIAVTDTSGNLNWTKNIFCVKSFTGGMDPLSFIPKVAIDNNQNVIIAGSFRDTLSIDGFTYKPATRVGFRYFVVKFNANGTRQWISTSLNNVNTSQVNSINISTDANSNVYVTGNFSGSLTFGSTTIVAAGIRNGFVVKYDPSGNFLWAFSTGSTSEEKIVKSKTAPNGTTYLISSSEMNPGHWNTQINQKITKVDSNGNLLWDKTISPAGKSDVNITIDNADNLYIAGNYTGNIQFSPSLTLVAIANYKTFLAKYSANGVFKWAKDLPTGNNYTSLTPSICFSNDNTIGLAGSMDGSGMFGTSNLTSSPSGSLNGFVVKTDTTGTLLWGKIIPGISGMNKATGITGGSKGTYYLSGLIIGAADFSGALLTTTTAKTFIAQLKTANVNQVSGNIFIDSNSNGTRESGEYSLTEGLILNSANSVTYITDSNGIYNMILPAGTFTLTPKLIKNYTYSPAAHSVAFSGTNQTITGKDFGLQPIPNQTDVKVTLTSLAAARPGFNFSYFLTIKNIGTTTVSDTVTLQYDSSRLNFLNSNVTPDIVQNQKLKWYYNNLQPYESRIIRVDFTVSLNAGFGAIIDANASIKPFATDLFQSDNADTTQIVVTGSFDPNDKQVNKPTITPAQAAVGEYLDYTIRFQNTGTDTAFTVIVTDKISEHLQLNTLEMQASSHPYELRLKNNNTLEWRFNNILLPDSNRNEPASHGFVLFRIKTKPGLMLSDSVANKAAIYFDFNTPVITNYAITRIQNPTGIKDKNSGLTTFNLYPNPANDFVVVEAELNSEMPVTIKLTNLLGQQIFEKQYAKSGKIQAKLETGNLTKGVYLLSLQTEIGMVTKRLVIH